MVNLNHRNDTNSFDMPNDSNLLFFGRQGGVEGPHGGKMKNWRCCSYSNFRDKNHRFHLPAKGGEVR